MACEVSIGGTYEQIHEALSNMLIDLERKEDPSLFVKGNGAPSLRLRFVDEGDPDWPELLVGYDEG